MKKTFITLLALAGVTLGADPAPVWTLTEFDLTTTQRIDLSSYNLSTAAGEDGYTIMLTFSGDVTFSAGAGSILWLSTSADGGYTTSTGTLGYRSGGGYSAGLSTFNAANGSSTTGQVQWNQGGISHNNSSFGNTTVFMTAQGGTATLYETEADGTLKLTSENNGLVSGDVVSLFFGNWSMNGANFSDGTVNVALYSGVLTQEQMQTALVPEPATATLSLLALMGLAARRRRK